MDGTLSLAPALELLKDLFQTGVRLGSSISSSSHLQPYRALVSSSVREEKYVKDPGPMGGKGEHIRRVALATVMTQSLLAPFLPRAPHLSAGRLPLLH